jgi:hypothetical protein
VLGWFFIAFIAGSQGKKNQDSNQHEACFFRFHRGNLESKTKKNDSMSQFFKKSFLG